ncbi:MAG TPA: hypothetical protein PLV00_06075 [Caldisericia bacterium]|nr:hypothetical protein [Caldisericia bacterium]
METIVYAVVLFLAVLAVAKCLIDINELNKRIDEVTAEEIRQNKRIDMLEKREQLRQVEQRRDKAYIETKNLFKEW